MGLAIPITNGHMTADSGYFTQAPSGPATPDSAGSVAAMQGTGALSGSHNTPLHVATVLLFAGGVIVGLHFLGFRFAFDVGMGR